VAAAGGAVWVASTIGGSLQRVDPANNRVTAAIPLVRPVTLVTLDDQLWASVLNSDPETDDQVVRIDLARNAVAAQVDVPVFHNIAACAGAIWAVDVAGVLRRIDPATGDVTEAATVGGPTIGIACNESGIWGIRGDGTIWQLPPAGAAVREAPMGVAVPGRSRVAVAPTSGDVWVAVPTTVLAINPDDLVTRLTVSLPGMQLVNDLWVTDTDVWLSANVTDADLGLHGGAVLRLDPATGEIVAAYRLGPESSGVVVVDGSVWAVDQSDNVLVRYRLAD
jgi:streptogramin lyase